MPLNFESFQTWYEDSKEEEMQSHDDPMRIEDPFLSMFIMMFIMFVSFILYC